MKRLITILVVSVLSVISINSSAVAGAACDACKYKVRYIEGHLGDFECSNLQSNDVVQRACETVYSSSDCSETSSWTACTQVNENGRSEDWCDDQEACTGSSGGGGTGGGGTGGGEGGGSSNTCPSNCVTPQVNYRELSGDIVEVTTRYCDASTNYVCRTKTENITLSTEKWFDTATADCEIGNCMDWDCVWTEGVGTTCRAGGTRPFCTCAVYKENTLKTVAVRLGCNSTTNTRYNCNGIDSSDDMDGSPLYCDLTASTSAGAGVCRYKKTCSTDCTNAWNVTGHVQRKEYLYRLKGSCDYTTGSCVSASGTVVSDFDYKCNHDNRAYETAPKATCTRMRSGKPGTCNGCSVCDTANAWETASNPAYQQQYHYNFSPISGTDRYQCVKTMNGLYQCNEGYYGNPGSSMTGCNACPTLEQSNLTIVSQNDACDGYHFVYTDTAGATSINDCYASTGNDGTDTTYCVAKMSDGTGTFYWSYNDAVSVLGNCNWQ